MHSCTLCHFKTSIELVPDLLMKRGEDSSPSSFSPMFSSSILLQSGKGRILIIINKSKILRSITYCIRYRVKCLHILSHLILTMTVSSRCNSYPHFPEEATEAQTGGVTCLGTQLRVFTVSGTPSSQNKESPRAEQGSGGPLAASLQHFLSVRHCVPEPQPPGPLSWEEGLLCG